MAEIKVSVIIPIYGVERYIERCARSLLEQSMQNDIEFIFVNDSTPDRSIEILQNTIREYPERREQVSILTHPERKGLAAARKTGVRKARGEYIVHCDSDDWAEPDMYRLMYEEAKRTDADIVGCDYIIEYEDHAETIKQDFKDTERNRLIDMLEGEFRPVLWLRMFRRSFYKTFGMDIPDITRDEDFPVSFVAHSLSSQVGYVGRPLYHYNRTNPGSITILTSERDYNDAVAMWSYVKKYVDSRPMDQEVVSALYRQLFRIRNMTLRYKEIYDPERWRSLWPDLKLRDCMNLKSKILVITARMKLHFILRMFLKDDISYRKSL